MGTELGHLPGSQQNQAQGQLAEGQVSRKRPRPYVFSTSPAWTQKAHWNHHTTILITLLCTLAKQEPQIDQLAYH